MRLPAGPWVGAPGGLSSGNRKKNLAGGKGIQSWPWVEEPFPTLSTRGHLCSVLQVELQGPRHRGRPRGLPVGRKSGQGRKHLSVPGLGSQS